MNADLCLKKRKIEVEYIIVKTIIKVIEMNNDKWLVEWNDKTRSWEDFNKLKNYPTFKHFVETLIKPKKEFPQYIT